ncbi:MAG TPA: ribonuclease P protein component [Xanthobacteraceae bacterium]
MRRFRSLRRQADLARLRRQGRRISTNNLTIYRSDAVSGDPSSLVCITVKKSIGKAVFRNKLRRRLAAIVHEALEQRSPLRLLLVARPAAASATFVELRAEVTSALGRVYSDL